MCDPYTAAAAKRAMAEADKKIITHYDSTSRLHAAGELMQTVLGEPCTAGKVKIARKYTLNQINEMILLARSYQEGQCGR